LSKLRWGAINGDSKCTLDMQKSGVSCRCSYHIAGIACLGINVHITLLGINVHITLLDLHA